MGYIEIPSFISGSTALWDADTSIWETNENGFGVWDDYMNYKGVQVEASFSGYFKSYSRRYFA